MNGIFRESYDFPGDFQPEKYIIWSAIKSLLKRCNLLCFIYFPLLLWRSLGFLLFRRRLLSLHRAGTSQWRGNIDRIRARVHHHPVHLLLLGERHQLRLLVEHHWVETERQANIGSWEWKFQIRHVRILNLIITLTLNNIFKLGRFLSEDSDNVLGISGQLS